ncbi:hypothetical protein niasHT_038093 [Heterodera trifolii]|uniref:DNA-directed RNA polymerase RpoA/D/Rpb3-type domain-containing protein n=1 Tax=Heterodera trifolii TaxID=157864 RepID=A0ABD2I4P7_9BILA
MDSAKKRTGRGKQTATEQRKSEDGKGTRRNEEDEVLLIEEETVANTHDPLPFGDGAWDVDKYCDDISLRMVSQSEDALDLEFDLVNVEAPIANALRRVLISEVPSMAIEKVFLYQNTSCIQDEVLCHRLGLIPIYADARQFTFPPPPNSSATQQINTDILEMEPSANPEQNLVFAINVTCPSVSKGKKKRGKEGNLLQKEGQQQIGSGSDSEEGAVGVKASGGCIRERGGSGNWVVYTSAFGWKPSGEQRTQLSKDPPRLVHGDIILAKLRPGQEIEASCHCVKGIGRDHAKFSPVATATYRLLPQIKLKKDNFDEEQAARLQSSFSTGVIGRDEQTGRVYVRDARADTSSRNIFIHDDLKDAVEMGKKKTHFIFSVESVGALPSHKLVIEACKVMREKVDHLREQISSRLEML